MNAEQFVGKENAASPQPLSSQGQQGTGASVTLAPEASSATVSIATPLPVQEG
jgi:hypothetical protein